MVDIVLPDPDLFEKVDTFGSTCWESGCDWDGGPERFTAREAIEDYREHCRTEHPQSQGSRDSNGSGS